MQAFALLAIIEEFYLYKWENQPFVVTPFCRREKLLMILVIVQCLIFFHLQIKNGTF